MLNVFGHPVEWCWFNFSFVLRCEQHCWIQHVKRVWPSCWMMLIQLFFCSHVWTALLNSTCSTCLATLLNDVDSTFLLFSGVNSIVEFNMLNVFGHPVEWCWFNFSFVLRLEHNCWTQHDERVWPPCWMTVIQLSFVLRWATKNWIRVATSFNIKQQSCRTILNDVKPLNRA